MHACRPSGNLIFYSQCVWILRVYAYGWSCSQFAFPLALLVVIINKFISKVITRVLPQDQPGSRNTVHKLIKHSRVLCLFHTFHMSVVCRKKAPILTSLSLACPSTLECLTDLGKYFNWLEFATYFFNFPSIALDLDLTQSDLEVADREIWEGTLLTGETTLTSSVKRSSIVEM